MEKVITSEILRASKYVAESTSFLELSTFSNPNLEDSIVEGRLDDVQVGHWIRRERQFTEQSTVNPPKSGSLRLLVQETVHPESFDKGTITLPKECWADALKKSVLSSKVFELATCPGLLLWTDTSSCGTNSIFEIVMQWGSSKHTSYKWVMSLSHNMNSRETVGFFKTTKGGDSPRILQRLKDCASQAGNSFLLPTIILHEELNHIEERQRAIRREVRRIEDALGLRNGLQAGTAPYIFVNGNVDFDFLNREIVETSAQLLKRRPKVYLEVLHDLEVAMNVYGETLPNQSGDITRSQVALLSRLKFQQRRVQAMERYHQVTSGRLDIQINALYNLIAQKDNKLSYLVATESRRIASASKYESSAMRTISILGVVFLPGTFVASVLSTSFFDFQAGAVSPLFWIYWALTVPLTLIVLAAWITWYRTNKRNHLAIDKKLEESMPSLAERKIYLTADKGV